jgi:glycosyltransferase involved in cell wall biosynthesis
MVTISYAITACNEAVELERLLDQLNEHIRPEDEIIVQLDTTATDEVKQVTEKYNVGTEYSYHRIIFPLNRNFAAFKNNLKEHCVKDYIFQIDADEYLSKNILEDLPAILEVNPEIEMYSLPRINTIIGELTQEHISKWGWHVSKDGWINYPDYQNRILKNDPNIKWINKVHEKIVGYKLTAELPYNSGYDLLHPKTIEKQEKQNQFYSTL